jgi:hypothetical protein
MDEGQRDVYNRFGLDSLAFDPRLDELKLLSSLAAVYLFWLVSTYIVTIPIGSRAARTWVAIFGIGVLILEISLCLTESSLPSWTPATLTEQELMRNIHSIFPFIIIAFANLATYLYVDIDKTSIAVLKQLSQHQKVCLYQLTNRDFFFLITSSILRSCRSCVYTKNDLLIFVGVKWSATSAASYHINGWR